MEHRIPSFLRLELPLRRLLSLLLARPIIFFLLTYLLTDVRCRTDSIYYFVKIFMFGFLLTLPYQRSGFFVQLRYPICWPNIIRLLVACYRLTPILLSLLCLYSMRLSRRFRHCCAVSEVHTAPPLRGAAGANETESRG